MSVDEAKNENLLPSVYKDRSKCNASSHSDCIKDVKYTYVYTSILHGFSRGPKTITNLLFVIVFGPIDEFLT